jgi:hypothetical protein
VTTATQQAGMVARTRVLRNVALTVSPLLDRTQLAQTHVGYQGFRQQIVRYVMMGIRLLGMDAQRLALLSRDGSVQVLPM